MTDTENQLRVQLIKRRLAGDELTKEEMDMLIQLQEIADTLIRESYENQTK